ncbi:MAG: ferredoxin [Candidatus Omnitrophota bacterium]
MAISKVWIIEGCIACGVCEACDPDVFEIQDFATVKEGVNYDEHEAGIKEAAQSCPVEVIKYE